MKKVVKTLLVAILGLGAAAPIFASDDGAGQAERGAVLRNRLGEAAGLRGGCQETGFMASCRKRGKGNENRRNQA